MLVLFPSNPLEPTKPDSDWAAEAAIAEECGHQVALVHHESLVNDGDPAAAVRDVPETEGDGVQEEGSVRHTGALYRGWMLTVEQYDQFYDALEHRNVTLITHPHEYALAQNLPEWYPRIEGGTPRTVVMPMHRVTLESVTEKAIALLMDCEHGVVIKDYVKSRKHEWEDACFIPDGESAKRVVGNFLERQGDDLQGGVVIREFVPLKSIGPHPQSGMPMSEEYRFFWLNGQVAAFSEYWPTEAYEMRTVHWPEPEGGWEEGMQRTGEVPKSIESLPTFEQMTAIVNRIGVPFFTMDLAQTADGEWIVMEIGDGQVSAFPQMPDDAEKFYPALEPMLNHEHAQDDEPPELPALTQAEMDPKMVCGVGGCDHRGHQGEMVLNPRCHVGSPTWCSYGDGVISITCAECRRLVARIAVAPGDVVRH